ncbi:MAG: prepilin-type N-terminal cleavage/methylation domain-containing protein [Sedimentisphaerales bacterium]|nr:prepilin-type N-terminal cleavage/methylation domain-containing protein [Sedimentisphaerales bacterium]MBN2842163.1 prepilin-type N-terminal cleavage/methylation domain-containing protein [Sedimentisphaerales bacterium]
MKKKAFTLIELLVVITIIALLVSILMPALSKAKEQAKITLCSNNLKQQSLAVNMYANANGGSVPFYKGTGNGTQDTEERWMWDLPYEVTRVLKKYAGIKTNEIYTCPSNNERINEDRRWWQYNHYKDSPEASPLLDEDTLSLSERKRCIRIMPYVYMFNKIRPDGTSKLPAMIGIGNDAQGRPIARNAVWVKNLDRVKMGGEVPLIVDATIEQLSEGDSGGATTGSFFEIDNGDMQHLKDGSCHKSRIRGAGRTGLKPSGANHSYVDGHVSWIQFNEMEPQADFGNRFWWKY